MPKKKKSVHNSAHKPVSRPKKDRWTIKRILAPLGFAALALLLSSQVPYTQGFRSNVLGDEDNAQEEQQKQEEEQRQEEQKRLEEQNKESSQNSGSSNTNTQRTETESESADGVKVKTKTEDNGATKVEVEGEGIHFKFEEEDGEIRLRVRDEDGNEVRTREHLRELDELEQELEDEEIEISSDDGHMELEHNRVRARINFPLSIDPLTRELIVTTPAGERTVAVLPDEAVRNLLAKGFLTHVASGSAAVPAEATVSGSLATSVELKMKNGNLVYEVQGEKREKFLGVIPVTMDRSITISALSGEVLSQTQSVLATILAFFSF
ncbi:MAG: hypothetical protein AAB542_03810 [Patescibacteria group bacterium]